MKTILISLITIFLLSSCGENSSNPSDNSGNQSSTLKYLFYPGHVEIDDDDYKSQVMRLDLQNGERKVIVDSATPIRRNKPNSRNLILFTKELYGSDYDEILCSSDYDGNNVNEILTGDFGRCLFLPNTSKIVYSKYTEYDDDENIYIVDLDGSNERLLIEDAYISTDDDVSPDETKFTYKSYDDDYNSKRLFYNLISNIEHTIISDFSSDYVSWDAQSRKCCFESRNDDDDDDNGPRQLSVFDTETLTLETVYESQEAIFPFFVDNGNSIIINEINNNQSENPDGKIFKIDADGSGKVQISPDDGKSWLIYPFIPHYSDNELFCFILDNPGSKLFNLKSLNYKTKEYSILVNSFSFED